MKKTQSRTGSAQLFKTDKRIRLGVWGLGRGSSFFNSCRALGIDVVAGCDFNPGMRAGFKSEFPEALVTDKADEFLARDFDAVLLATYCPAHADDAIACLKAGKHVLSEVTSFHTMAEGVRLVEAVEKSGRVYNLAENYPFSAANMWLQRRWQEGLFGEMMYAEYEYVHEWLALSYSYINLKPVVPGNQAHSWRSWLHGHYYNTHSLGPVMYITGLRPTRVTALPGQQKLPGYLPQNGRVAPSLINMSNGSIMRNLMGATTNDGHCQRIWGTRGAAQMTGHGLQLRLGGRGNSVMLPVTPRWERFSELAGGTGHGGGDFWVLYFFARQVLEGIPAPFDIYTASDCTIPGIQAYRSALENGKPYEVPDFRDKTQRELYRNDHFAQERFDYKNGLFPKGADESLTLKFASTIVELIKDVSNYRAYRDWSQVAADLTDGPGRLVSLAGQCIARWPQFQENRKTARQMVDRYPESAGARVLRELLEFGDEALTAQPGYLSKLKDERRQWERKSVAYEKGLAKQDVFSPFLRVWQLSKLLPVPVDITQAPYQGLKAKLQWVTMRKYAGESNWTFVGSRYGEVPGMVYLATRIRVAANGRWELCLGHTGQCRVFVDGRPAFCEPRSLQDHSKEDGTSIPVTLKKGGHEIVVAIQHMPANAAVCLRFRAGPKKKGSLRADFPVYV